jgi:hypothetical protein
LPIFPSAKLSFRQHPAKAVPGRVHDSMNKAVSPGGRGNEALRGWLPATTHYWSQRRQLQRVCLPPATVSASAGPGRGSDRGRKHPCFPVPDAVGNYALPYLPLPVQATPFGSENPGSFRPQLTIVNYQYDCVRSSLTSTERAFHERIHYCEKRR